MRRLALLGTIVGGLALAATAQAKGPIAGTIEGPGTGGGISIGGSGEPGNGAPLGSLAEQAGFFPAAFGQSPDPLLAGRPKGDLGPRYTITYRLPGPNGREDRIRQHLYPYAKGGPVTYTPPWQRFFGSNLTRGGWYRASPALKTALVSAGLPETAPSSNATGDDGGTSLTDLWPALAFSFALALAALTAVLLRRRPRATATG